MTFLKKHALKLFIILSVIVILFLLWYHLFPVKIPFDHTLYSETGEEVTLTGEIQYYRSISSKGGKTYGEVTFNGVKYGLPYGGPYMFDLYDLDVQAIILQRDRITINFQNKEYNDFFITKSPYPRGNSENYFLTKPEVDIEAELTDEEKQEIKLKNYEEIDALSKEERAEDFLKALTQGNIEKLDVYFYSDAIEELLKADLKAEIVEVKDVPEFPNIEYQAEVKLTVENSKTPVFENGIHSYLLLMRQFDDAGFVKFFAPRDKLDLYLKANESKDSESIVYKAQRIVSGLMTFVTAELTEEKIKTARLFDLAHALVHSCFDVPYVTTKEEFKKLAKETLGIFDEEKLCEIAGWLDFKYKEENGVYNVECAHCFSSVADAIAKVEETENGCILTYNLYSDFSYVVKCATLTVTFEENSEGLLKVVKTDFEKHLDYPVNYYSA